jgi:ligand-binding SRPBCC domain-containing protein
MVTLVYETTTRIRAPVQALFAFHQDPSNLHRIQPPGVRVMKVILPPEWCVGARLSVRIRILGLVPQAWEVRLEEVSPPTRLVDVAIRGPYPEWRHVHAFQEDGPGHSTLTDRVEYQPPWGRLGVLLDRVFFRPQLAVMFAWRHRQTRRLLESMPERCVEGGGTGPGSASSTFQGP